MLKILLMLFVMSSCSTGYYARSWSGGYSEQQLAKDMYRVTFSGNRYTAQETAGALLLKRCAELTQQSGYSHFVIIGAGASRNERIHGMMIGNQFAANVISEPTNEATIKMMNDPGKDVAAYDAEIIFGGQVQRDPSSFTLGDAEKQFKK